MIKDKAIKVVQSIGKIYWRRVNNRVINVISCAAALLTSTCLLNKEQIIINGILADTSNS